MAPINFKLADVKLQLKRHADRLTERDRKLARIDKLENEAYAEAQKAAYE